MGVRPRRRITISRRCACLPFRGVRRFRRRPRRGSISLLILADVSRSIDDQEIQLAAREALPRPETRQISRGVAGGSFGSPRPRDRGNLSSGRRPATRTSSSTGRLSAVGGPLRRVAATIPQRAALVFSATPGSARRSITRWSTSAGLRFSCERQAGHRCLRRRHRQFPRQRDRGARPGDGRHHDERPQSSILRRTRSPWHGRRRVAESYPGERGRRRDLLGDSEFRELRRRDDPKIDHRGIAPRPGSEPPRWTIR